MYAVLTGFRLLVVNARHVAARSRAEDGCPGLQVARAASGVRDAQGEFRARARDPERLVTPSILKWDIFNRR